MQFLSLSKFLGMFKVLYSFSAEEEGELTVEEGMDVVASGNLLIIRFSLFFSQWYIIGSIAGDDGQFGTEDDTRDGWVLVETQDGRIGYVPAGL